MSNKAIYAAIIEVTKRVGTLGKGAFNPHGQYKYVSIDKYYEAVGAAAADVGLSWYLVQDKFEIHPSVGKSGMVEIGYAINIFHESGESIPSFSYTSVIHPIQGAQTIGSAMSYADKVFQRQLFKIATGEEDADSTNAGDLGNLSGRQSKGDFPLGNQLEKTFEAPKQPQPSEADLNLLETSITTFIPECPTTDALMQFYHENEKVIKQLKEKSPEKHKAVMAVFTSRKQELMNTNGGK
jgi:hypothetical protein